MICIIISATAVTATLVQLEQSHYVRASPQQQKENVTITVLVQRLGKEDVVKALLNDAVNKVRSNHSDLSINLKYVELHDLLPAATKDQKLRAITNGTNIDIISLDQIWLGEMDREFANRKFAVMIEGSWMPGAWANLTRQQVDNIGFNSNVPCA